MSLTGSIFTAAFANPGSGSNGTIYYLAPNANTGITQEDNGSIDTGNGNFVVAPAACTVAALNVGANNFTAPIGVDSATVTVYKNSVLTAMKCTVTVDGNGSSCADTTDTFTVAGGDTLSLGYSETNINPFVRLTTTLICQ